MKNLNEARKGKAAKLELLPFGSIEKVQCREAIVGDFFRGFLNHHREHCCWAKLQTNHNFSNIMKISNNREHWFCCLSKIWNFVLQKHTR